MFDKLIELLVASIRIFQLYHIVRCYQRGVILRFGKYARAAEPGMCWVIPFMIEELYSTNVMPEPMLLGPQALTTADGRAVNITTLVVTTIDEPKKFLLELEGGIQAILLIAHGVVARFVETRKYEELLKDDPGEKSPSKELKRMMRAALKPYGVGLHDAQVTELTLARSIRLLGTHGSGVGGF